MVRIKDIAQQLGVSSTTVSNVIHGKANKASPELVERIQKALDEANYVPNMAGVLLSQNTSKIIAIVLSNDIRYGDKLLQDPFISEMLAGLEESIREKGYFTMLHNTHNIEDVTRIATMWNVSGIVLFGFDKEDYVKLRKGVKIPIVSVDGYSVVELNDYVNIRVDDEDGGYKMARHLLDKRHKDILYLADNNEGKETVRIKGIKRAFSDAGMTFDDNNVRMLSVDTNTRLANLNEMADEIKQGKNNYTALFFASDRYAVEAMNMFQDMGIDIPGQVSVVGFDDTAYASVVRPYLTTVKQDILLKSVVIINTLMNMINKYKLPDYNLVLPVEVVERKSVRKV